jgi:uncharacterized protein (TIGR02594 family)
MTLRTKRRAAILLCSVALAAMTSSAFARPAHRAHHHHHRHTVMPTTFVDPAAGTSFTGADRDPRYTTLAPGQPMAEGSAARRHGRHRAMAAAPAPTYGGGFASSSVVEEARKYIGTNPTGRRSLWCGASMDMVLKRTGHAGGGNLAKAYASYGQRISGPQVGAIAVMGRRGGGHVGVVSGIDPNGNPIIVSGNHNHTVAESVYPAGRIQAYVLPGG